MVKNLILLIILVPLFSGCLYNNLTFKEEKKTNASTVSSDIVTDIRNKTKGVSKEDAITLYKLFKGYSFLINNATPDSVLNANNQLERAQQIYGWEKNKYPEVGATLKEYLIGNKKDVLFPSIDMSKPHKVIDVKEPLSKLFDSMAEGIISNHGL